MQSMGELKQSLMATTLELDAAKEELKKKEQSIAKLADLVRQVAKERDDARDQLQHLLAAAAAKPPAPPPPALVTSSVTDSDGSLVSSPVDHFFDPVTSSDKRCNIGSPPPAAKQQCHSTAGASADAVLDMLAMKKPLPQRGRLLQSVMEAGPLLQNLLVAGLLPRWRNPPPVALDTLPLGAVYSGASLSPGINSAAVLGYGGANACGKRPMPAMAMAAAASCSPAFSVKRHRLH
ncbi:hypothetical protein E2562_008411 [Oryza meyeriana var. granulata]|uniref:Uncharacterized protein n=1 Tax=Oryza meyeriana var. granulata TaxID=110450 RepID=A0A6G1EHL7_9ORYZ|nr:hypothetical protein E2562_008411 [Oryza meyeriana var. granulata]